LLTFKGLEIAFQIQHSLKITFPNNPMTKDLVFSITPDGYAVSLLKEENGVSKYQSLFKNKTDSELSILLARLPEGFYKEGINVHFDYDNESAPMKIPQCKREQFEDSIRCFEASDQLFG
jgi:hypothetical protein